ncbi:hypothetical protein K438DRAFT_1747896 [Mycena galopus ATCC 62051]|nr:hypothetical protein K438DRAFT_1747896 [Mycena galopus ATCC 62051]
MSTIPEATLSILTSGLPVDSSSTSWAFYGGLFMGITAGTMYYACPMRFTRVLVAALADAEKAFLTAVENGAICAADVETVGRLSALQFKVSTIREISLHISLSPLSAFCDVFNFHRTTTIVRCIIESSSMIISESPKFRPPELRVRALRFAARNDVFGIKDITPRLLGWRWATVLNAMEQGPSRVILPPSEPGNQSHGSAKYTYICFPPFVLRFFFVEDASKASLPILTANVVAAASISVMVTYAIYHTSPMRLTSEKAYLGAIEAGVLSGFDAKIELRLLKLQIKVSNIREASLRNSLSSWLSLEEYFRGRSLEILECIGEILKEEQLRELNPLRAGTTTRMVILPRRHLEFQHLYISASYLRGVDDGALDARVTKQSVLHLIEDVI